MSTVISVIGEKVELPKYVIDEAESIYKDNLSNSKYRRHEYMKVASLYMACRINGIPRTLKDFAYASNIRRDYLFKEYSGLFNTYKYTIKPIDPIIYLNRISSYFKIDIRSYEWAQHVLTTKEKQCALIGSDPMIRTGSILYLACVKNGNKDIITQKDMAEASQCSDSAIREHCKKLINAGIC